MRGKWKSNAWRVRLVVPSQGNCEEHRSPDDMKINEEEGEKQLQIWRNRPRLNITDAMHTAAEQSALQAIGHITLTGASDEQMEAFEDEYNRVIRALLNDTPFT